MPCADWMGPQGQEALGNGVSNVLDNREKGGKRMFTPYTAIDQCVGKEVRVRTGGEDYVGMLAGVYTTSGVPILVITPMSGKGMEQHIPLVGSVVSVQHQ